MSRLVMPVGLVEQWAAVYGEYVTASELYPLAEPGDVRAAFTVSITSGGVAVLWREMSRVPGLPWWTVAALGTAAQAFEMQERDWRARSGGRSIRGVVPPRSGRVGERG